VTGVYGVSFLIIWFALALASAVLLVFRRPTARSVWAPELFLPGLTIALVFHFGTKALREGEPAARSLRVTLVQPSIPQTLIWDSSRDTERFQELVRLSDQALSNRADLLVWPEAAVPKLLRYDETTFESLTALARRHQVWLIVGSDDFERRLQATKPDEGDYYNSSFLISPDGKLRSGYRKRGLVIFGEYVPFTRWLPFLKWFTPIEGGFTPGLGPGRFELTNLDTELCVLICFEDIFPHMARADRSAKTDLLINLTNDGWFGEGSAQWQHGVTGLFRAIENGLPLVRCTNTGLTCWIDQHGRLRDIFRDARGTIYGPGFLTADIPLPPAGTVHRGTFYSRNGDWFGWLCVSLTLLLLARRLPAPRLRFSRKPPAAVVG
jgi:apolipoprotein N-acyltransferase